MKTRKVAAKRFKITSSGKVLHATQGRRHLRRKKSASRKRRQDRLSALSTTKFIQAIKTFLQT